MKVLLSLTLLLFAVVTSTTAQTAIFGTWLFKSPDGELANRISISENQLVYERLISYKVETPYWEEDKTLIISSQQEISNGYQVVGKEDGQYYAGELVVDQSKTTLFIFEIREGSSSAEEAFEKLNSKSLRQELSKRAYTQERLSEIDNYPSLDEIKKEEVIEMMNHVYEYEKEMAAFKGNDRIIGNLGRSIMNQKLIVMGFDPDKPTNGYYMKRFANDPDIKQLLDKQEYFRMY